MNAQHYYRNISLDLDFASWASFTQGLSKISGVAFARFLGCCTSFLCKAVLTICGAIQTLTKALRPITDPERLERFPTFQHIKSTGGITYIICVCELKMGASLPCTCQLGRRHRMWT
jgi:hypothetical protein